MRGRYGREIRGSGGSQQISTTKCGRQQARRRSEILCRIDLYALKARRDLDADAVTRSLQGAKIYAKKQARAYNDGRY